jgi:hypothetical protein
LKKIRKSRFTRLELPPAARNFPEGFYSGFTLRLWINADVYWKIAARKSPLFFVGRQRIRRTTDKKRNGKLTRG